MSIRVTMQKTSPKIVSTVSTAKIYLYHISKTAKTKPNSVEFYFAVYPTFFHQTWPF